MKKTIFLFLLNFAAFCPITINAQVATSISPCDSIQMLYNDALVFLDSTVGLNNKLTEQLDERLLQITKLKNEINSILRKKNDTLAELNKTKKLISEQMEKIEGLETEVKRLALLSKSSNPKKN